MQKVTCLAQLPGNVDHFPSQLQQIWMKSLSQTQIQVCLVASDRDFCSGLPQPLGGETSQKHQSLEAWLKSNIKRITPSKYFNKQHMGTFLLFPQVHWCLDQKARHFKGCFLPDAFMNSPAVLCNSTRHVEVKRNVDKADVDVTRAKSKTLPLNLHQNLREVYERA